MTSERLIPGLLERIAKALETGLDQRGRKVRKSEDTHG